MYKDCKTEQSIMRQREMEQGLLLMMQKHRYEDISVSDLCAYLQIPRKSFYRYFFSKDGALYALLDHVMMDFFQEGFRTEDSGSAIEDLDRFFAFWYHHKELLDALRKSQLSGILVERATSLALRERMIPRHMQKLPQKQQEMAMSFSVCGLLAMVLQWHQQGFCISVEEITKLAKNMLAQPLLFL